MSIIATGPLTNIAQAISEDAETMRKVEKIWWMGGAYATFGNISPVAEFNAFCDPEAAQEVLSFGIPMNVVGLDVCMTCPFTMQELDEIKKVQNSPTSRFAWDICQMYMHFYKEHEGFAGCYLHDPLAVAVAIWPDLITSSEPHHVHVVTDEGITQGMTIVDRRPRNPWLNKRSSQAISRIEDEDRITLQNFSVINVPPHVEIVWEVDSARFLERYKRTCFGFVSCFCLSVEPAKTTAPTGEISFSR